jgi:hypothetical protein
LSKRLRSTATSQGTPGKAEATNHHGPCRWLGRRTYMTGITTCLGRVVNVEYIECPVCITLVKTTAALKSVRKVWTTGEVTESLNRNRVIPDSKCRREKRIVTIACDNVSSDI